MKEVIVFTQRPEERPKRQSAMVLVLQEFKLSFASLVAYYTELSGSFYLLVATHKISARCLDQRIRETVRKGQRCCSSPTE
jgi:hypothetical protein